MSCFPELTYAIYVDGELPVEEARQVEVHLVVCRQCQILAAALRTESGLLAEVLQETEEVPVPATAPSMRPRDILWTALVVLAAAAGLQAVLNWVAGLRAPAGADWLNPFTLTVQLNLLFSSLFYFVEEGVAMLVSSIITLGTLVLGLLVVAGGLFLLRRRPATAGVLATLALMLSLALPGAALERRKGTAVTIARDETIDDTLLVRAETVIIDGIVTGNLVAFGERVEINGTVKGDVVSCASMMPINGTVEGNVLAFSSQLTVRGQVRRNIYAFASQVQLEPSGRAEGDVFAFTGHATVKGTVGRDVLAFAGITDVQGTIGRHLTARTGRLSLLGPAHVGGNLTAYVRKKKEKEKRLQIDPSATIAGETKTILLQPRPSRYTRPKFYFWQAGRLAAAFLTGLVLFWLFPVLFAARLQTAGAVLRTTGVGFLALVATPVAALIVAITIIGLPIALLGLVTWLAGLYLAKILVAAFLGQALMRPPTGQTASFALALLVGLVIVLVAINVPYVGGWIHFLAVLLGLGAAVTQAYRGWHRAQPA